VDAKAQIIDAFLRKKFRGAVDKVEMKKVYRIWVQMGPDFNENSENYNKVWVELAKEFGDEFDMRGLNNDYIELREK